MSDLADNAEKLQDLHLKVSLAKIQIYEGVSADNCRECGFQIPSERQRIIPGTQTCAPCANIEYLQSKKTRAR
jgi:RNA polymerase-binding transcription factor DksA